MSKHVLGTTTALNLFLCKKLKKKSPYQEKCDI